MTFKPMPEGVQFTLEIPDWLKIAIADAVVIFGRVEQEAIEVLWLLSDADLKKRLKISRNPSTENFIDIIGAIEKESDGLKLDELKETFRKLADDRNLVVHGAWTIADEKPWVVWHKFAEDTESIIGEYFEQWRFKRFMARGTRNS